QIDRQRGFTLLEILIAVAIFTIVGAMAMGGYNELSRQSATVEANMERVRAVQGAVMRLSQDFGELEPRPIRESVGDGTQGALKADGVALELVSLTRSGWTNTAGVQRSTLQRVTYRVQDGKLYRDHWAVLDRTLAVEPQTVQLLDKVTSVKLRFMDQSRAWREAWPGSGAAGPQAQRSRPLAVEVTLELEDWGSIVRLVEVAG
ncbi:MAG: type II secretion system minor pseudopilin GspJ, partial [Steroidobacteraceae bacterium]